MVINAKARAGGIIDWFPLAPFIPGALLPEQTIREKFDISSISCPELVEKMYTTPMLEH